MDFTKYNSIKNVEQSKFIEKLRYAGLLSGTWVRTLKIHGANYSFWTDGKDVNTAKRSGFINDEVFYGDINFVDKYIDKVSKLFEYIRYFKPEVKVVSVHGEVYGGIYPHPDVKKSPNATRVQKEVYYRPDNEFIVFDIAVDGKFVNTHDLGEMCQFFAFDMVPVLDIGNFFDLINADVVFEDPLYQRFDLPKIDNNFSEGWVLRPVEDIVLPSGERVILKGKNPKFKERAPKERKQVKKIELTDEGEDLLAELRTFVTANRLYNVISHVGEDSITDKDFGKLLGMLMKDIMTDFIDEYGHRFEVLEKGEKKAITKMMQVDSANLLRTEFVKLI